MQLVAVEHVALQAFDCLEVDDGAAVDLRELLRIEALHEFLE